VGLAVEADSGSLAHQAVHPVAGNHVGGLDLLLALRGGHRHPRSGRPLRRRRRRRAAMNLSLEGCKACGQDPLGLVLRENEDVRVPRRQPVESELQADVVAVPDREAAELQAARDQRLGHVEGLQGLQRVGVDDRGARGVLPLRQAVDQQVVDPGLAQGHGEGEAGGSCADDQHFGTVRQHVSLHLSTCVDFLHSPLAFVNAC
jgi:hypothetical protein